MVTRVQHQTVTGAGAVPALEDVRVGEIVVNLTDGRIYTSDGEKIVELQKLIQSEGTFPAAQMEVIGKPGDFTLDAAQDNTLYIFTKYATVTIPENVVFRNGYRVLIQQYDVDANYVFLQTAPSINLISKGNINATNGQYSIIELIHLAGSNWTVRGDGATQAAPVQPPAEETHLPNTGIKFTTDSKLGQLNLGTQVSDSQEFAFRAFVKMASYSDPTPPDPGTPPDPPPPDPPPGTQPFSIWSNLGYRNMDHGLPRADLIYGKFLFDDPSDPDRKEEHNYMPPTNLIQQQALGKSSALQIIDIEKWSNWHGSNNSDIAEPAITWFKDTYDIYVNTPNRPNPGAQVMFYGEYPWRFWEVASEYDPNYAGGFTQWRDDNDTWQPVFNHVKTASPSCYFGITGEGYCRTFITNTMDEVVRMAQAWSPTWQTDMLPVYIWLWPQMHQGGAGKYYDAKRNKDWWSAGEWRAFLDAAYEHPWCSGIILWGNAAEAYKPANGTSNWNDWQYIKTLPWWQETLDFMNTNL